MWPALGWPGAQHGKKKETLLGLSVKKADDFGKWYSEVVVHGEMIDYYDVSGCYILRPWSYSIWESIKSFLDDEIKKLGVENAYFPLFVSEDRLTAEKDHVEGFAPEEGHTAFATKEEADDEVKTILALYKRVYEDLLAVPVIPGIKSEKEKFAGGLYTTTVEAYIPATGRGIQGATSHCLGQNFAKMFDIQFEAESGKRQMVWQNSWGLTTRTIGVMVMVHADDKGLVLPPRVAPLQCVVVPIPFKDADREAVVGEAARLGQQLRAAGVRTKEDARDNYSPGWKYNHWELKGVVVVRRDTGAKEPVAWTVLVERVKELLDSMQADLLARATEERDRCIAKVTSWDDFVPALDDRKMVLAPWCDEQEVEEDVKRRSGEAGEGGAAKTLCMPFEQPDLPAGTLCFASGKPAKRWALWGRSY
eukprot:jgi/Mesen1/4381/ME000222S03504